MENLLRGKIFFPTFVAVKHLLFKHIGVTCCNLPDSNFQEEESLQDLPRPTAWGSCFGYLSCGFAKA